KEVCGIANYTNNLIKHLDQHDIYNQVYPINRLEQKYLSLQEIDQYFSSFCQEAKNFDLVHIQHEYGFFHGSHPFGKSIDIFHEILKKLEKQKKKVIVSFHTDPIFVKPIYTVLLQRNKDGISQSLNSLKWKLKIAPFFQKNQHRFTALVHTKRSRLEFLKSGFSSDAIKILKHGVTKRDNDHLLNQPTEINKAKLNLPPDSKLLSIFGFVSHYKGYRVAIEALNYLPDNYYLAVIGGVHPSAGYDPTLDQILKVVELQQIPQPGSSLFLKLKDNIKDRVVITGFVDFDRLNLFQGATDICLAPYIDSSLSASGALTWSLTSGKPIIASKIPAFQELNEEADCLALATINAPNELAWQILNLAGDAQLSEHLVRNALNYAEENSWENISSALIYVYKNVLN
ncbi:MAG: glycosyltransferase, partial [Brasilonema sp.]